MLSLAEKTVLVTRPREQAAELKSEFERLGAKVVLFPTIAIVPPDDYADLDAAILNLSDYDWLVVTSANAVEYFLQRLTANNLETAELDYLRVCAIGEATFESLRRAQIHVDVLPAESRAENVFAALTDYLGDIGEFKDLRFLLPCSSIARDYLPKKLSATGAIVKVVSAYQTILPQNPESGKIKALLEGGAIDCATFTSPSTLKNFIELIGKDDLTRLLSDVKIACLGETTAQAARESGLIADVVSSHADARNFASAVADFYQQKSGEA